MAKVEKAVEPVEAVETVPGVEPVDAIDPVDAVDAIDPVDAVGVAANDAAFPFSAFVQEHANAVAAMLAGGAVVVFADIDRMHSGLEPVVTQAVDWAGTRPDGRRTLGRTVAVTNRGAGPLLMAQIGLLDAAGDLLALCEIPGAPVLNAGGTMEFRPGSICF